MNKNFHFIVGRQVTDKDKKAAPPNSVFRSASAYSDGDSVRDCKSCSGAAPQAYRAKFEYIEARPKSAPKVTQEAAAGPVARRQAVAQ